MHDLSHCSNLYGGSLKNMGKDFSLLLVKAVNVIFQHIVDN